MIGSQEEKEKIFEGLKLASFNPSMSDIVRFFNKIIKAHAGISQFLAFRVIFLFLRQIQSFL